MATPIYTATTHSVPRCISTTSVDANVIPLLLFLYLGRPAAPLTQATPHERNRAPSKALWSFHATPSSTRVHAFGTGCVEPYHRDGGRPAGSFDSLDQVDKCPWPLASGDNEHTCEPRGQSASGQGWQRVCMGATDGPAVKRRLDSGR